MLAADYDTVTAKLWRARENAERFKAAIQDFLARSDTYELIFEVDRQAREVDVFGRFREPPPIPYWGAIFGDVIHCFRSALDHLVWALSVRYQDVPPPRHPTPGSPWRYVGFPVALSEAAWNGALGGRLALVDPKLHARFRELQPLHTGPEAPEREPLAMLDGLWNVDKHRVVHFANMDITLQDLTIVRKSNGAPIRFNVNGFGQRRLNLAAFDAETQLAWLQMLEPFPASTAEMKVDREIRVDVLLDHGAPAFGEATTVLLDQLVRSVVATLVAFEPEFT